MQKFHWKEPEIPWQNPMPKIYFKTFTYQDNEFALHLMRFDAGFSHPAHTHDMEEYGYMLKGKIEMEVGDQKMVIGPGDYMALPPNTPHSALVLEDVEMIALISPPRPDIR
jgi:quercetin dioxygenase-like cupin family protein